MALKITLPDLLKAIEDKLHCSGATVEQFDDDFDEWLPIQSTGDLRIFDGATLKVRVRTTDMSS